MTANRYARTARGCDDPTQTLVIDVYSVLDAYAVDHKLAHAIKKLLCPGGRSGGKPTIQDLEEAAWTISRAIADLKANGA